MDADTRGNPVRRNFVTGFVGNVDSQVLQGVEAAFQEANGVLRTNAKHRDMLIECLVVGLKYFGVF